MISAITGFETISCFGDATRTFEALCRGESGRAPLCFGDSTRLGVRYAHEISDGDAEQPLRATRWLQQTVLSAVGKAGLDPRTAAVAVIVGTGLRELRQVERWWADGTPFDVGNLDFARAIREVLPAATEVVTLSNACSASGFALAIAEDLLAGGEATAVVAAGCDSTTESMLAMMGRVSTEPSEGARPFDQTRSGTLLGEGAVAVVVESQKHARQRQVPVRAWLRGVGLSCDAYHETAPDVSGFIAAMRDAHSRTGLTASDVELVVAHGTGTALNDPTEITALAEVFGKALSNSTITGIKGGTGHTSGSAALMSLVVAVQSMESGLVPPIIGLRDPIEEARDLRLVHDVPLQRKPRIAQVNAFGFGGVNAVTMVEAVTA